MAVAMAMAMAMAVAGNLNKDYMKKLLLWITRNHKWHKDWLGCWICEMRMKNNNDKPVALNQ